MSLTDEVTAPDSAVLVEFARRIHDTVGQRLAGLSYLLAVDGGQPEPALLERCRGELDAALAELRSALTSVASMTADARRPDVEAELTALREAFPGLDLQWTCDAPKSAHEGLKQSFLVEALRNIRKHARPSHVSVELRQEPLVSVVQVSNDGVLGRRVGASSGSGRRLLEVEASLHGALVDSSPQPRRCWKQRLIMPAGGQTAGEDDLPLHISEAQMAESASHPGPIGAP